MQPQKMHKYSRPGAKIKQGLSEMRAVFENPSLKFSKPHSPSPSRPPPGPPPVPPEGPPDSVHSYHNGPAYDTQYQGGSYHETSHQDGSPDTAYHDDPQHDGQYQVGDQYETGPGAGQYDGHDPVYQQPGDRGWTSAGTSQSDHHTYSADTPQPGITVTTPGPPPSNTTHRMSTVQRNPRFNPEQAAKELKHAMDGKGCNEELIIQVLTDHNNAQRQEIKNKYRSLFGKELDKELKKELKGKLETVVMSLLTPPREYLAHELRGSMKGLGTDEQSLIDIMMPRTNREVKILKETFKQVYGRDLEKDIHAETSGKFREVMLAQAMGNRDATEDVMVAIRDAEDLTLAAREKKWDSDSVLYRIMFKRSHAQLRAIFKLYENATGQDIEDSIKQRTKGDLENSLIGMARASKGIRYFYATRLYEAMKGKGMNDEVVIRTLVSRSEIDLARVAEEYQRLFQQSLSSVIASETKGSYQTILLRLLA